MMTSEEKIHTTVQRSWSSAEVSDVYEQTRPNHDTDAVEFLLDKLGVFKDRTQEFVLVELGAGTGKFTRAVLRVIAKRAIKNFKIISTEPIKEMCEKFRQMVPNVEIHQRPAHDLGLPSGYADAVVAAQCFHWFANDESICEIQRVLKESGTFGIIWNIPDRTVPYIAAIEDMLGSQYKEIGIASHDFSNTCEYVTCVSNYGGFSKANSDSSYHFQMEMDLAGINARYSSYSVISAAEKSNRDNMLSKIQELVKMNLGEKSKEKFSYNFEVYIHWFTIDK